MPSSRAATIWSLSMPASRNGKDENSTMPQASRSRFKPSKSETVASRSICVPLTPFLFWSSPSYLKIDEELSHVLLPQRRFCVANPVPLTKPATNRMKTIILIMNGRTRINSHFENQSTTIHTRCRIFQVVIFLVESLLLLVSRVSVLAVTFSWRRTQN